MRPCHLQSQPAPHGVVQLNLCLRPTDHNCGPAVCRPPPCGVVGEHVVVGATSIGDLKSSMFHVKQCPGTWCRYSAAVVDVLGAAVGPLSARRSRGSHGATAVSGRISDGSSGRSSGDSLRRRLLWRRCFARSHSSMWFRSDLLSPPRRGRWPLVTAVRVDSMTIRPTDVSRETQNEAHRDSVPALSPRSLLWPSDVRKGPDPRIRRVVTHGRQFPADSTADPIGRCFT